MAMTLLALISMAGLKIMQLSESSFSEGRTQLTIQQQNQAIIAFINDDFKNQLLAKQTTVATYKNMAMPADLRGDHILNLATIFGNGSRFAVAVPKFVLVNQAEPTLGYFTFAADCDMVGGKTIASLINIPLDAGAKIAFAIDGAGARCKASKPITNVGVGMVAKLFVDDPACLRLASDATKAVPRNSHTLFPRFVAFEKTNPARYYTSFFENSSKVSDGINLTMPDYLELRGGQTNPIVPIDLRTLDPKADVSVGLKVNVPLARLRLNMNTVPQNIVKIRNNSLVNISINGQIGNIRTLLNSLTHETPVDFYGDDTLAITAKQGPLRTSGATRLDIKPNCAN
jgi:hypothetical protein